MSRTETIRYDDAIVRKFVVATLVWGAVGMLVGLWIALELAVPRLNFAPYFTFGRLRPLHTNAVIFAFAGNAIFAAVYYSTQRLLKTRMFSDKLSKFHFWGWQLIIVAAAITLPLGFTQGKEYAELEWPIDIAIAVVWVAFAVNVFGTLKIRRERHIYVAIWFYLASIVAVAILHIFNNLVIPSGLFKSYSIYAGVQDAFMQWWYGHNAVGFVLTTPFLGLMYYFLPKAAGRPVYSYRLSILHFWSLVFIYIWAGPHHLHYTALPDWASTLGMVFSVMLWMPSWGGMFNGLLTLRGAWHKVDTEPVLKFFVVGLTFYGMSTFEGPAMSIKSVNALSHYTNWTIAHVHGGALGWVGFMTFGMIYWLWPRLWQTELYSKKLATTHFWIATIGIVLYIVAMWTAGITEGLMWRAFDSSGRLQYDFLDATRHINPMNWVRAFGGALYITGLGIMGYNLWQTWRRRPATLVEVEVEVPLREDMPPAAPKPGEHPIPIHRKWEGMPALFTALDRDRDRGRLAVRDRPDLPDEDQRAHDRERQAVHAARAVRPRHLRPRGLLQLPLADDPAVRRRGRPLRRVLQARRVRLRPPVPVGQPPARPRPGARGRQARRAALEPVARAPPRRSAVDLARLDHAVVPPPGARHDRLGLDPVVASARW